jgi:hypothetical protein
MSSGAFALYIDQQPVQGPGGASHRIVPLPLLSNQDEIHFDYRRLTLSYDGPPSTVNVTGRFLPSSLNVPINVTLTAGQCHVVDIPREACAASLTVNPGNSPWHGPVSALVEYNS